MAVFGYFIPGFFKPHLPQDSTRQLGEFAIVVTGLTVVMLGGGIDLSVGSIFALASLCRRVGLLHFRAGRSGWRWRRPDRYRPRCGALNGYLVGYLRLRAFLTTLVTFIIGRALFDILVVPSPPDPALARTSDLWDFIGDGTFQGLSISVLMAHRVGIITHLAMTRSRPGWHVLAVGGSQTIRLQFRHPGAKTVFMTYVFSGLLCGLAGFLIACRLSGAGPGTGLNLEIMALTASVVGGNTLGGGRGSVAKGSWAPSSCSS